MESETSYLSETLHIFDKVNIVENGLVMRKGLYTPVCWKNRSDVELALARRQGVYTERASCMTASVYRARMRK